MDISVFDGFPDGILILDGAFNVKYLNTAATGVFHLSSMRQMLNKNIFEKFPDLKNHLPLPIPDQLYFREISLLDEKLGRPFYLSVGAQILTGTSDILIYARDISVEIQLQNKFKREKFEKSLALESAVTDSLTGFLNKEGLFQQLTRLWARIADVGGVFSILVLDLDNFKSINDTYGHSVGDKYLQEFAYVLRQTARGRDIYARFGGDEFVIVANNCLAEEAEGLAKRLLHAIAHFSLPVQDKTVGASASIGISCNKQGYKGWREMFDAADSATLEAKRAGKNTFKVATSKN